MTPKGSRPVRKAGWWAAMPTWLPDYLRNRVKSMVNDKAICILHSNDDIPLFVSLIHIGVRLNHLFQWIASVDYRLELSGFS
jgi:hypothetical protein